MSGSIQLHPTLGVNPRLTVVHCQICAQEETDNELVLLGASDYKDTCPQCDTVIFGGVRPRGKCPKCGEYKGTGDHWNRVRLKEGEKMHRSGVCSTCKKHMSMGILLVQVLGDGGQKYRVWSCSCGCTFPALVKLSEDTPNLSGEATAFCPKCGKKPARGTPEQAIDLRNPPRTGRIAVVTEKGIREGVHPPELAEDIIRKRVAFIPAGAWEMMGLPNEDTPEKDDTTEDNKEGS